MAREQYGEKVQLKSSAGIEPIIVQPSDGQSNVYAGMLTASRNQLFNGSTFDRQYNNNQGTLAASQARTSTTVCATQTNFNAKGVIVFLNVTVASGTGGLTVRIRAISPAGVPHYLNVAPAAITSTGSKVFELYPASTGAGPSPDIAQRTAASLPRTWTVEVTHGDSSSYTYQVDYALIL